jgi:hypothetical protein
VGRSAFELARSFDHVDAIDFSARFIQSGVRLQDGGEVHYEIPTEGDLTRPRAVSLERLGLASVRSKVEFMQGDACNLPTLEALGGGAFTVIHAANLLCRLPDPM